ncbi:MAG: MerR family transcriptional regulator [Halanaerobiales bacterium]
MKISEFADKYSVSYDTVRYYMELHLLTPEKKGGHYYYDEKCEAQIREVLKLKEMDFSLQEIKKIFNFKRIGKLSTYHQNNYYQSIYKSKYQNIKKEISRLKAARDMLEETMAELVSINDSHIEKIGIDLTVLSLFACPECKGELSLSAEKVEANQIIDGSMNCNCGESLSIRDGILYTNFEDRENGFRQEGDHIEKYINEIDPEFIDALYHNMEWMKRQCNFEDFRGKVLMDPGSGFGFFLRQIYSELPEETIYICVDINTETNYYLKQLLEMTKKTAKIIFITADLPALPLKENVVDIMMDFSGTSSYSFENTGFLPCLIDKYMKRKATMISTYIMYHTFGPNNIVPEKFRHNFRFNKVRESILSLNYEILKENKDKFEKVEESYGQYEQFAQPGDQIFGYQIVAKRVSS